VAAEKDFEQEVKDFLIGQFAYVIKYWGGGIYTRPGVPDLLVCINGFFIGVELKGPKGKPSDVQLKNIFQINRAGGLGLVLWPAGFEAFKTFVKGVRKCSGAGQELKNLKDALGATENGILIKQ
jgi:hypothetical protein